MTRPSHLEWRCCLELCRDPTGIDEVVRGLDFHTNNQEFFGLPSRLIAKIYLFRQIFRGSAYAYANDPDFATVSTSVEFWEDVEQKFFQKYPNILKAHNEWAEYVKQGQPIPGPFGRDWKVEMKRNWRGELQIPWTQLSNYPVQGTGADVMMLARLSLARRLQQAIPYDEFMFISTVHDDIKIDAKSKHLPFIAQTCHNVFRDLIPNIKRVFGYDWVVPMTCEVSAGMNMRDMETIA